LKNRQVILRARPVGIPQASDFELRDGSIPDVAHDQILVRNRVLSVDPAMRIWLGMPGGYVEPIALGSVIRSFAVGEVVRSRHSDFLPGDKVVGLFGWQEFAAVDPKSILWKIPSEEFPLSYSLGVLGINGIAAYLGMTLICRPRAGETVVVSTGAGAVGSGAGQIAGILGARVVGIAGGPEKCRRCMEDFGFHAAVDYKAGASIDDALSQAAPGGVDAYFDNTAGEISDAVRRHLNVGARIALCGTSGVAGWSPWPHGERVERHLLNKRALMQGFVVTDHVERYSEALERLGQWVRDGNLTCSEHVLRGIDRAPEAIAYLYEGRNHGKLLIEVG
jgi:NADPH-dependent curcumin reductase CurA